MLKNILLAGLGGSIGTMLRFASSHFFRTPRFPFATLSINVIGSLIIGVVFGLAVRDSNFDSNWKVFLASGICGGFTTFSAFSLENLQMLQQGKYFLLLVYILSSIIAGIFAAWIGYKLVTN